MDTPWQRGLVRVPASDILRSVGRASGVEIDNGERQLDVDSRHYLRLREEILNRDIAPGEVLLETAISARYGVSRTPIRIALDRLEHDGLIERASRGFRVKTGSAEDILDIYEARIALESAAAAGAALRRTELELARLRHLHEASVAAEDTEEAHTLHRQWHGVLWSAGHNRAIESTLARLCDQLTIFDGSVMVQKESIEVACAEHERIIDAVARRDPDAARDAVAEHLTRTRDLRLADLARS